MITFELSSWGLECKVNGLRFCILTSETPQSEIDSFKLICEHNTTKLNEIVTAYEAAVAYNHSHPGEGKDWPVFRQRERLVDRLLSEAGVQTT